MIFVFLLLFSDLSNEVTLPLSKEKSIKGTRRKIHQMLKLTIKQKTTSHPSLRGNFDIYIKNVINASCIRYK